MGPATRSRKNEAKTENVLMDQANAKNILANQAKTENVLADNTNLQRMSKKNESNRRQCIYSQNVGKESIYGGSAVYDFIGVDSPSKKKKSRRKRKSDSDDDIVFSINKVENIRYNTRQKKVDGKMKGCVSDSTPSEDEGNLSYTEGGKQGAMLKKGKRKAVTKKKLTFRERTKMENKENVKGNRSSVRRNKSYKMKENKENMLKENELGLIEEERRSMEGNIENRAEENKCRFREDNECMIEETRNLEENKENECQLREGNECMIEESKNMEENKENMMKGNECRLREVHECMMDYTNKTLDNTKANLLHGSRVIAGNTLQNEKNISQYSENTRNYSIGFGYPRCSYSPIDNENKSCYITKRQKRKRYCVEDFTVENFFGFAEESDDEVRSPEYRPVLYMCSTPNDKNEPTRPYVQMSQIFLPPKFDEAPIKTCSMKVVGKDKFCTDSTSGYSLPLEVKCKSDKTLSKLLQVPSAKLSNVVSTSVPPTTAKLPCVASIDVPLAMSKLPQVTSTDVSLSTAEVPHVTSTKIQVTSSKSSNKSPVLFDDDPVEQHFNRPPRKSYERAPKVRRDSQTELESGSEDETANVERKKRSKKQKTKEARTFAKWAANVSAEFEEVESFELYVE